MLDLFIEYLEEQVKNRSIYVWGGQGEGYNVISESWIRKMENSTTNANRAIAFWKKKVAEGYGKVLRAFDCSGLGMYFIQNIHGLSKVDMNADMMKDKCTKINKSDLKRGDWAFRVSNNNAYHIGYFVDDKLNVIESKGRDVGVIKSGLNSAGTSYWNYFGRPIYFKKEIESDSGTGTIVWDGNGWQKTGEHWYYYIAGVKQKGWQYVNYKGNMEWFYLDPVKYTMVTGWVFIDNQWYYMDKVTGVMKTGWFNIDGYWYYLNPSKTSAFPKGAMRTGWVNDGKADYYMVSDEAFGKLGHMSSNSLIKDIKTDNYYLVGADGKWDKKEYKIIK